MAQTHCVHGHAFNQANTYLVGDVTRRCRRCQADRAIRYRAAEAVA